MRSKGAAKILELARDLKRAPATRGKRLTRLQVRAEEELVSRVDAVRSLLSERAWGVEVGQSDVLRLALQRGLAQLEEELGRAEEP